MERNTEKEILHTLPRRFTREIGLMENRREKEFSMTSMEMYQRKDTGSLEYMNRLVNYDIARFNKITNISEIGLPSEINARIRKNHHG